MAVKQKAKKRSKQYYERTYRAIGLVPVKCILCGDWFGVKVSVFNLNLICQPCKVKFYAFDEEGTSNSTSGKPQKAKERDE